MALPVALASYLESHLGRITETIPVSGGDISQVVRVRLAGGGQLLVKWRSNLPPGLFTAERRGLELLRSAGALRVPEVLAQAEATANCPAFIALEWLDPGSKSSQSAEVLGHGLAVQHRLLASSFGLDHANLIGANPQPNHQSDNWASFFREQRLGFQMELAGRNGVLPTQRARRLEALLARLGDWLPAQPPASLLHGDLWGGNWLATASGEPVLIDPAVYYGHREADLAFTELFGGFPAAFYSAYQASWPLDRGYEERKDLYNLYHLLNHLNLFGESYGGSVDSILRRYAG
ncbi:MAG: fructosamine kinase family protein [Anaerolineales bacterium]|nr:fructosamine kinase family protein [Anaerolineales bacterium]